MRHAKSDWADNSIRDFDRPLNKRGKIAAPIMGQEIKKRELNPDLIISSPALRAKMTAEAVAEKTNYNKEIVWDESFYFGYTNEIIQKVKKIDENFEKVIIFGHNPTWSAIAEKLSGEYFNMKTADLVVLEYDGKWKDLKDFSCKVVNYISPKELIEKTKTI